jgi:hypothetical protein
MRNLLAALIALVAACLLGFANALEHREVQALDEPEGVRLGMLARLARRRWWLVGMGCDVGSYVFYGVALAIGGLIVVQPLLPMNLLFALPLAARWQGRRIARDDFVAAAVLCGGIAMFLYEADPDRGAGTASFRRWLPALIAFGGLSVLATLGAGLFTGGPRATCLGLAAGVCNALMSAFSKTFVTLVPHGPVAVLRHWESYGLAVTAIGGLVLIQSMFQNADLAAGLPLNETVEPLLAAFLGASLFGETINGRTNFDNVLIGVAVVMMIASVAHLSRSAHTPAPQLGFGPHAATS